MSPVAGILPPMPELRLDPWDPGYGMGFDAAAVDDEQVQLADAFVETDDWATPRGGLRTESDVPVVTFVDGVRRIEARLMAADGDRSAHGMVGSFAVGAVTVDGKARFDEMRVHRSIVLGSGMMPDPLELTIGRCRMHFSPASDAGAEPDRPLVKLQSLMRETEAALARSLAEQEGSLVLLDGPLTFFDDPGATIAGVIKRFAKHYLDAEQTALLPRLRRGERTPLFALGTGDDRPVQRYSWYSRIADLRPQWHGFAGIVRCDLGAGVGVDAAIDVADTVSSLLPRFAGRPTDPRAPQNLAPVGGLESKLRHAMGETRLIKRALTTWLLQRG